MDAKDTADAAATHPGTFSLVIAAILFDQWTVYFPDCSDSVGCSGARNQALGTGQLRLARQGMQSHPAGPEPVAPSYTFNLKNCGNHDEHGLHVLQQLTVRVLPGPPLPPRSPLHAGSSPQRTPNASRCGPLGQALSKPNLLNHTQRIRAPHDPRVSAVWLYLIPKRPRHTWSDQQRSGISTHQRMRAPPAAATAHTHDHDHCVALRAATLPRSPGSHAR